MHLKQIIAAKNLLLLILLFQCTCIAWLKRAFTCIWEHKVTCKCSIMAQVTTEGVVKLEFCYLASSDIHVQCIFTVTAIFTVLHVHVGACISLYFCIMCHY